MNSKAENRETNLSNRVILFLSILMGAVFLPVLFCVLFIGSNMDYNEGMKLKTLLPNYVLGGAALAGIVILFFLGRIGRRIQLTQRRNWIINGVLALLFVLLYFVNIWIAKEIVFQLPWDIMMVRGIARDIAGEKALGEYPYLSMYTNNISISYILGWLYKKAKDMASYPYFPEFIWIQVNCVLISLGGFFSCLTVKKLTRKIMPVAVAFFLYLALAGISAWKIAPYTDTYGMIFPIMSVFFYLCYRDSQKPAGKYIWAALSLISGMIGGWIKPSAYVMVIAVLGVELVFLFLEHRRNWKYFTMEVLLTAALLLAGEACMNGMIKDIGLAYNPEVRAGWQNYFLMGLNEGSTGSYASEDVTLFGEFQTDRDERNHAALERAVGRMKEKGILGTVYFWLRKMVMTFNDGTFGWECEVWIDGYYPENMASDSAAMQLLRNIFWPNMPYTGRYNTFCQLVWIFCMTGFPGILLLTREKREKYVIFIVSFLGIFFYQMLFEARARYLFVFLPLLVVICVCGMCRYGELAENLLEKRKSRGSSTEV